MTEVNQSFDMYAGDHMNLECSVKDEDGVARNITGCSIAWYLRTDATSPTNVLTKTTGGGGITITDAANGLYTIALTPTDTSDFAGQYYHKAVLTDASSNVSTIMEGFASILPTNLYCTLVEIKNQIEKTGSDDDMTLQALIGAASRAIDNCCNRPDGFVALATATARLYSGSGTRIQWIDECVDITKVEVKESVTDDDYEEWDSTDYIKGRGDPKRNPEFNRTPYEWIMVAATGSEDKFTSGLYSGLKGFRPDPDEPIYTGQPTVRITANWGYSVSVPLPVKQACMTQVARWYKRGQSAWADVLGTPDMGVLAYRRKIDPDIAFILQSGRLIKVSLA